MKTTHASKFQPVKEAHGSSVQTYLSNGGKHWRQETQEDAPKKTHEEKVKRQIWRNARGEGTWEMLPGTQLETHSWKETLPDSFTWRNCSPWVTHSGAGTPWRDCGYR